MSRLVLIDTADQLPGLLPIHSWSALLSSELVLVRAPDHPFVVHLDLAELRWEAMGDAGTAGGDADRAKAIVARAQHAGEAAYLYGEGDDEAFTRALGLEAARQSVEVEIVYFMLAPKGIELLSLVRVEERLRGLGGCPWDREQTHASLAPYALEEACELADAIASGQTAEICEELGDLLLQVVFQAQIAADASEFDIDEVAKGIRAKLIRRHPHVFGDDGVAAAAAPTAQDVQQHWERLKAVEKPEREGPFAGIPSGLPALQLVSKLQSRAERAGLAPDDGQPPAERIRERLERIERGADHDDRGAALGELLAAAVALARAHGLDAEQALRSTAARLRAAQGAGGSPPTKQGAGGSPTTGQRA